MKKLSKIFYVFIIDSKIFETMKMPYFLTNCILITWFSILNSCAREVDPPQAVLPVPTERQMAWHELEQYAFICFGLNTFTDKEWGYGDESPSLLHPVELDARQWAKTVKAAGLKGIMLVCKHHDGFCLWPSQYTEYSVKNSPFRDGKGDIVKEVSDACHEYGIKFGVYLSPWDRNHAQWGSPEYLIYYRNQLRELLTNYGEVFMVWFDGAHGGDGFFGGARENRIIDVQTYYEWPKIFALCRELAPMAALRRLGPDVRWCGNERGFVGDPNWNLLNVDDALWREGSIERFNHGDENGASWLPAEVDVSIRPGWFYHAHEDDKVRTPENLLKIYLESVGRGAVLNLNIPPDRRGLLHENDVKSLMEWKNLLDRTFSVNLAARAKAKADSYRGKSKMYAAANVTDGNRETYWATDDSVTGGTLEIDLGKTQKVNYVVIREYVKLGQRVKDFNVEAWIDNTWKQIAKGTTIGYKRILQIDPVETRKIRINIVDAKACPLISTVEAF